MKIGIPFAVLASASVAAAHLDTLFNPQAGQVFKAGVIMAIKWEIGNNHNGIDIHLSTDDKTWTTVVAELGRTSVSYNWKVPALATQRARIRICQKSGPSGCTDADSVSAPDDGPTYALVSGRFRIESAPTGLIRSRTEPTLPVDGIPAWRPGSPGVSIMAGLRRFDLLGKRGARVPSGDSYRGLPAQ